MKTKLNEKVEEYFNKKADGFLYELKPDKRKRQKGIKMESSASHVFVSEPFTEEGIININSLSYVDGFGQQVARYFIVDKVSVGLDREAYASFEKFIESLYRKREINPLLSLEFVKDCAFEWFEKKHKGNIPTDVKFLDFLTDEAQKSIKRYKISIPIYYISIQAPFKVGNVLFEYFTKEFFDEYFAKFRAKAEESQKFDENKFKTYEINIRKRYQGVVFASMHVEAEKFKCVEIASEETEKALMVLRLYSPTAYLPQIPCYFGIMGRTHLPKQNFFIFENRFPEIHEGIAERRRYAWDISNEEISELKKIGFDQTSNLIAKQNLSKFEKLLINSMSLFARSLTSRNYQDRIVYALVSAETLLLQNQTEPIQSSVGLRLAFLTQSKPDARKKIKSLIKNAYKIRSSYIHHGKTGQDWSLLRDIQHIILTAIKNILALSPRFKSQKDLIDYLENLLLS